MHFQWPPRIRINFVAAPLQPSLLPLGIRERGTIGKSQCALLPPPLSLLVLQVVITPLNRNLATSKYKTNIVRPVLSYLISLELVPEGHTVDMDMKRTKTTKISISIIQTVPCEEMEWTP